MQNRSRKSLAHNVWHVHQCARLQIGFKHRLHRFELLLIAFAALHTHKVWRRFQASKHPQLGRLFDFKLERMESQPHPLSVQQTHLMSSNHMHTLNVWINRTPTTHMSLYKVRCVCVCPTHLRPNDNCVIKSLGVMVRGLAPAYPGHQQTDIHMHTLTPR